MDIKDKYNYLVGKLNALEGLDKEGPKSLRISNYLAAMKKEIFKDCSHIGFEKLPEGSDLERKIIDTHRILEIRGISYNLTEVEDE